MEPTSRLYHCLLCQEQVRICRKCDHGNIYCGKVCAVSSRKKSMKLAGIRYQATFKGKCHHAARQAAYRRRLSKIVTHHGSPLQLQHASMESLENKPEKSETGHQTSALICGFCGNPISYWIRNDFLRRKRCYIARRSQAFPQAP